MVMIILTGYKRGSTLNMKKWLEKWKNFPIFDDCGMIKSFK